MELKQVKKLVPIVRGKKTVVAFIEVFKVQGRAHWVTIPGVSKFFDNTPKEVARAISLGFSIPAPRS